MEFGYVVSLLLPGVRRGVHVLLAWTLLVLGGGAAFLACPYNPCSYNLPLPPSDQSATSVDHNKCIVTNDRERPGMFRVTVPAGSRVSFAAAEVAFNG